MKPAKKSTRLRRAPALTPEEREEQLIALAVDRVEERMRNGEATSAEYVHFLKLASQKNQLELEKLRKENELLIAKTESYKSAKRVEELYEEAMNAYKLYSGFSKNEEFEE